MSEKTLLKEIEYNAHSSATAETLTFCAEPQSWMELCQLARLGKLIIDMPKDWCIEKRGKFWAAIDYSDSGIECVARTPHLAITGLREDLEHRAKST